MHRRAHKLWFSLCLLSLPPVFTNAAGLPDRPRPRPGYGDLPLTFEANRGQTDPRVDFLARGKGYLLFLTSQEAVLKLKAPIGPAARVVRLRWAGASGGAAEGLDELPGKSHYFLGNDAAKWRTNIPTYARVRYRNIYPGIDVVFRAVQGRLEYDLEIAAGADASLVRLAVEGVNRARIDASGDLVLEAGGCVLRQPKPAVYQTVAGVRHSLDGRYILRGKNLVGFQVTGRDPASPLTIDPVVVYSTYLGGSSYDSANGVAVDAGGKVYVTGVTGSSDFPASSGAVSSSKAAQYDAFVAKFNASGSSLEYATYVGGGSQDTAARIVLDSSGNAHVAGWTGSPDFPTTPAAFQRSYGGGLFDAFVFELNSSGSSLLYCTYLGGRNDDVGSALALDASGRIYVAGYTESSNFPTTAGAFQTEAVGSGTDAFVTKLDLTKTPLVYSTRLGGGYADDSANAIQVDASGSAYVAGLTYSDSFPVTPGVFQRTRAGHDDSFLARLNPSGTALIFGTYLGGNCEEEPYGLALDQEGNAYMTGYVETHSFPATPGAFQTTHAGDTYDAFVAKVNPTGTKLLYATYLGGMRNDLGFDIAVDDLGNAYVLGVTGSENFPTTPATLFSPYPGGVDAFLVKLNPRGSHLAYSTYLGGTGYDEGHGIALDASGAVYVVGETGSADYVTTAGAPRRNYGGGERDAFVTKLQLPTITTVSAASFQGGAALAPESIAAGYGPEMSPVTQVAPDSQPLPTSLGGLTVTIRDNAGVERQAPLWYVSPGQINYQVPQGASSGTARVTVKSGAQVTSFGLVDIDAVGPGLFTPNYSGQGPPVASVVHVKPDSSQTREYAFQCGAAIGSCVPAAIDMGPETDQVFLELYGTGIRGAGSLAAVSAKIGGVDAPVQYAGAQSSLTGVDQVNVQVPRSLKGRGQVDLVLTVAGKQANTVKLDFQ